MIRSYLNISERVFDLDKVIKYYNDEGFGFLSNDNPNLSVQFYMTEFPDCDRESQLGENISW